MTSKEKLREIFFQVNIFPARAFAICMGIWGVDDMLENWQIKPFHENFPAFLLTVALIIVIVEFTIYYFRHERPHNNLIDALTEEAEKLLREGKFDVILNRRNTLSRSLWIEGKPRERIRLGEIAKEAAIRIGDTKAQTEILIDDLGWTLVSIEKYKEAKEYLTHGLQCAISIGDNYLAAKANRHLAGILAEGKDFGSAKKKVAEAEEFAIKIQDENKKNEMLAGIYYGLSVIHLQEKNIVSALDYAEKTTALRLSNGDQSRYVKIYSLKGTIYEAQGNKNLAEENFLTGITTSTKLGRVDEMIRNHLGLARIAKYRNDTRNYNYHLGEAQNLLKKTSIPFKIDEKEISLIQN